MQDQNVKLGELYSDEVTNFAGIATGCSVFLSEPSLIHLENDSDSRWIPVARITPGSSRSQQSDVRQLKESAQQVTSKTVSISSS